ncbi:MAG TPA: hypothetical protein VNO84_06605 [Burkholderiaceae bacterium]|nr:hypothetical protein [Burkholderiaceae bacterium]
MSPACPSLLPSCSRDHLLALWLAAVVLLQAVLGSYLSAAVAGGTSVCSATGTAIVVDADGEPLPAHAHFLHDGCCTPAFGLHLAPGTAAGPGLAHEAPTARLSARRLAAAWMAPLSRGPPAFS